MTAAPGVTAGIAGTANPALDLLNRLRINGIELWADGDALRYRAPVGALTPDLSDALRRHKPAVLDLLRQLTAVTAGLPPLEPRQDDGPVPLSFGQRRLWFLDQADPASPAYNLPYALRLRGRLDVDALRASLTVLARRHDALRTVFPSDRGEPRAVVLERISLALPMRDLRGHVAPDEAVQALVDAEFARGFDLEQGPLVRFSLTRLGAEDHLFLLTFHHIVFDGWSFGVFMDELARCYEALVRGADPALSAIEVTYADYACWQRDWAGSGRVAAQLDYWRTQLAGAPIALELPTDRPRPARQTHRGDVIWLTVPDELADAVHEFARTMGATPFMVLLAAWQSVLARWGRTDDIVVGTPVAGRQDASTERIIGFFVNMLALRTDLSGQPSFRELVRRCRDTTLGGFENQDLPFDSLVEELQVERDLSRTPVFQSILVLQNLPASARRASELTWEPWQGATGVAKYDVSLVLDGRGTSLSGGLEYNADLFDRTSAERMARHFLSFLRKALADPDVAVAGVAMGDECERLELMEWNDTAMGRPEMPLVTELFAAQVARRPDSIAAICEDTTLTYADLDARANLVAHRLIAEGAGPGVVVGLMTHRRSTMLVGLLGILKAGAAYVPLDPAYPSDRLAYMLDDSGATMLATDQDLVEAAPPFDGALLVLDSPGGNASGLPSPAPAVPLDPEDLAYILYTSGSTGRPKGVEVPHRAVVNALLSSDFQPTLDEDDTVLAVVSVCFDGSVTELLRTLTLGARLVVVPRDVVTDAVALLALLESSGATVMMVPTPFGRMLLDAGWAGDGRLRISLGGEALTTDLAKALRSRTGELWNEYGPTETTVLSTSSLVGDGPVTIGRPIDNTRVVVLDERQCPVPVGVPGEICIGGLGLARGYHDRPGLTAERFVPDPSPDHPGSRLYRTGDLGRWRPDGELEHLGRLDHQVKLRGYRIETGEIEAVLETHPGALQAAVVLRQDATGDPQLVGYVVPADRSHPVDIGELREHLGRTLPDYMVPAVIVPLEAMPTTPVGKLDHAALPAPALPVRDPGKRPPSTPTERRVARVWADVLGLEATAAIGADDDFFSLGGESMKAVRAVRALDERLPVLDLFAHPTVAGLAAHLDARDALAEPAPQATNLLHRLTPTRYADASLTLVCVPFGGGGAISYRDLADRLPRDWAVAGLEPPGHDFARRDEPLLSLEELARRCAAEILRDIPGPVALYGHCVGSAVAVAIARELEDAGRWVLGVAVGANFPAARLPGVLGWMARAWPGGRMSNRALQDSLRALGGLSEELPEDEQRVLARNVRHDAREAEAFYTNVLAHPSGHRLNAPILAVQGGQDRMSDFAEEQVEEWRVFSDHVDLAVIPDAEHFFSRQQAPQLAELLSRHGRVWREPGQGVPARPRVVPGYRRASYLAASPRTKEQPLCRRARLSDFGVVALGQLVSMVGTGITTFALGVWAYQVTGLLSTFAAVQLFGLLPAIAAGPIAGAVADRFDRRSVMIACDVTGMAMAATVALLALTGRVEVWHLFVIVSAAGLAATFRQPAYLAGATQLVPKRYLGQANGLLQLGTAGGLVFAQLAGGVVMATTGLRGAALIDVASYAFALGTLWRVRFPNALFRRRRETFLSEIRSGWRFLVERTPLLLLTGFFAIANTFGGVVFVLMTPLALTYTSANSLGTILAAQGVGMLVGGAVMAVWGGTRRRSLGMVGSVAVFAVSTLVIGASPGQITAMAGMFGIGVCASLISAHWLALVQVKVPTDMQGRLVATCMMLARLATPLGVVAVGPWVSSGLTPLVAVGGPMSGLTHHLAATTAGRALALGVLLTGLAALVWTLCGLALPSIRDADSRLADAADQRTSPSATSRETTTA